MRFLQHAKEQGDLLIVAVLGDYILSKIPNYRFFGQSERANSIAALHNVDYVVILDGFDLPETITAISPNVYILGTEYEKERADEVKEYVDLVYKLGGKVKYHSGDVHYTNSELFIESVDHIQNENQEKFDQVCRRYGINAARLKSYIGRFEDLSLMVLGDTIVDQYVNCDPVGMSAEAPVLVLQEMAAKEFLGGAAIVACHIRALGAICHFISVTGSDQPAKFVKTDLLDKLVIPHLFIDAERPTTFKIRYMVGNQKLLRVSRMKEHAVPKAIEEKLIEKIEALAPEINGIVISDFTYGVITPKVLETVIRLSRERGILLFGDLQCSSQVGNVAKFKGFDLICPTEREARIALSDHVNGLEKLAMDLLDDAKCRNLLITLGSDGFVAYQRRNEDKVSQSQHFPALVTNPVDVAGAGDSLLSVMALSHCSGANLMESSVLGACVAAITVNCVGNIPIDKANLVEYIDQLNLNL